MNSKQTHDEDHSLSNKSKLNSLRAAVLGSNDGIVSVAGIVAGVAGASSSQQMILTAGIAGLVAGALSMAVGEYISVSSTRDTEKALLHKEKKELEENPEGEMHELAMFYEYKKGLKPKTALIVAKELMEHDSLRAHAEMEFGIDPDDLTNPTHAAVSSAVSFVAGAIIPLLPVIFVPQSYMLYSIFGAVLIALVITGILSAKAGGANKFKATARVVFGGLLAMIITYFVGRIVGFKI